MNKKTPVFVSAIIAAVLSSSIYAFAAQPPEPQLPDIPGITTKDEHPNACVDCHKNYPERKMDARLTTIIKDWIKETDPKILKKAQATMPEGVTLKGKHPDVVSLIEVIPDDCLMCHNRSSKKAPKFSKLLHAIHLTGGKENHFVTIYKGQCTNCHKLNLQTGEWGIGSGKEQK